MKELFETEKMAGTAFGWGERGAAGSARIIIGRITTTGEWDTYWKGRLRLTGNVVLVCRGVSAAR